MSGRARYAAILRAPHVASLLLASMLARLPYGVYALAAILYLAEARDSYAVAGLVDGAFGLGAAAGAPLQSRLIDRLGQRRVLLPAAIVDVAATGALIALTESGAPSAVAGGVRRSSAASPSRTSAARCAPLWPELLRRRDDLLPAAFALDSVALELLFTPGPLIAALVVAVASPVAALVLCAGCSLRRHARRSSRRPPSRAWRPDPEAGSHGALGALRSSGVRTVAFAAVPVGFCFGAVEISLPAFAEEHGAAELAGVLLATWAVGERGRRPGLRGAHVAALAPVDLRLALAAAAARLPPRAARALDPGDGAADPARRAADRAARPPPATSSIGRVAPAGRGDRGLRVAGHRDARRLRARHGARRPARRGGRLARVLRRGGAHGRRRRGGRLRVPADARRRSRCDFALHGRLRTSWAHCSRVDGSVP